MAAASIEVHFRIPVVGFNLAAKTIFVLFASAGEKRNNAKESDKPKVLSLVAQDGVHFRQLIWLREALGTEVPGLDEAKVFRVSTSNQRSDQLHGALTLSVFPRYVRQR